MIKHNLCSRLTADLLWFCKHNSMMKIIGNIVGILIPSELCINLIAFGMMIGKAGISRYYLPNLMAAHIIVISAVSFIVLGYFFVVLPIKHAFRRYKVNVKDAYMQKKIQQNN